MNQAAGLVSGAIGDGVFKTVVLGGRAYTVYAPTIYVIAKLLRPLGCVDLEGVQTKPEVVRVMPEQGRWIALAVAVAITGDVRFAGVRARQTGGCCMLHPGSCSRRSGRLWV